MSDFSEKHLLRKALATSGVLTLLLSGCESNSKWVDDRLDTILAESDGDIGGNNRIPETEGWMAGSGTPFPDNRAIDNVPPTDNPPASELPFKGQDFHRAGCRRDH